MTKMSGFPRELSRNRYEECHVSRVYTFMKLPERYCIMPGWVAEWPVQDLREDGTECLVTGRCAVPTIFEI